MGRQALENSDFNRHYSRRFKLLIGGIAIEQSDLRVIRGWVRLLR
jgi:hypothetical protein